MTTRLREQAFESKRATLRDHALEHYLGTLIGQSVQYWQEQGVIGGRHEGYGIVVKVVRKDGSAAELDLDPTELYDYAFGHGESRRLLYRAVCKQRAAVRTGVSTAELDEADFQNVVTDRELDGPSPRLGEYPHRGGAVVEDQNYQVYVSMSGCSDKQDHAIATFLGEMTLLKLEELDEAEASAQGDQPVAATGGTVSEV